MKNIQKILILGLILCSSGIASFQAHDGHKKDIVETAIYGGIFKTFISAIKEADLVGILQKKDSSPFASQLMMHLPRCQKEVLNLSWNLRKKRLREILKHHIIKSRVPAKKISSGTAKLKMLNEKRAVLSSKDGKVKINQANILKADIMAKNGIIHIIDEVLLPQE